MTRRENTPDEDILTEAAANAEPQEESTEDKEAPVSGTPTLADRFIGINELVARERKRTRLSESTLTKNFELALQYHAWQTQVDAQEAARNFDPAAMFGGQPPVEPDEYIGPDNEDNVVEVDFEATNEESTDA